MATRKIMGQRLTEPARWHPRIAGGRPRRTVVMETVQHGRIQPVGKTAEGCSRRRVEGRFAEGLPPLFLQFTPEGLSALVCTSDGRSLPVPVNRASQARALFDRIMKCAYEGPKRGDGRPKSTTMNACAIRIAARFKVKPVAAKKRKAKKKGA